MALKDSRPKLIIAGLPGSCPRTFHWGQCDLFSTKIKLNHVMNFNFDFNPCCPEDFSQTYFPKGGCCNPLRIINIEGHITINLLPVYRYGHLHSIDTKISTNHYCMTSLWRHNVSTPSKIEKWSFCVSNIGKNWFLRKKNRKNVPCSWNFC